MHSRAGQDYTIEPIGENNYADVAKLHYIVFGKYVDPQYYRNKYNTSKIGLESIGFLISYKDKTPVAFCGMIACHIGYQDQRIQAGQFLDAMTHPQHRGKGLYMEINELICSTAIEKGFKLFFGFPNQNAHPMFLNRAPWVCEQRMQCFEIKTNAIPFSYILKIPFLKAAYKGYQNAILKPWLDSDKSFSNLIINEDFAGVVRDRNYIDYKSYTGNKIIHLSNGAKAWIKAGFHLYLGDIELNGNDFESTLNEIKKIATRLGISRIIFQTSEGTALYHHFKKHYQSFETFFILLKDEGSDIPMDQLKFSFADIDIF